MTDAECLAEAIARTGHRRFAELLDPAHPAYDRRYWATVRFIATGEPPRPDWRLVMSVQSRAKLCPHYRPCATGCGGATCAMGDHPINPWADCGSCWYLPDDAP